MKVASRILSSSSPVAWNYTEKTSAISVSQDLSISACAYASSSAFSSCMLRALSRSDSRALILCSSGFLKAALLALISSNVA